MKEPIYGHHLQPVPNVVRMICDRCGEVTIINYRYPGADDGWIAEDKPGLVREDEDTEWHYCPECAKEARHDKT